MTDTRWLDQEEQRTWRSFLMAGRLMTNRLERDLKQDSELSFAYYEILARLSEAPGRSMRMATLAAACVFDRSRLSHAIDRLVRDGWVRRVPIGPDARGQMAELTDQGMTVVHRAATQHVERVRELMFDRLTREQQNSLREICEVLTAGMVDRDKLRDQLHQSPESHASEPGHRRPGRVSLETVQRTGPVVL